MTRMSLQKHRLSRRLDFCANLNFRRTAVLQRVLEALMMTFFGGSAGCTCIPWTAVLMRVLEALEMTVVSGSHRRLFIPRTAILMRVLEALEMSF